MFSSPVGYLEQARVVLIVLICTSCLQNFLINNNGRGNPNVQTPKETEDLNISEETCLLLPVLTETSRVGESQFPGQI